MPTRRPYSTDLSDNTARYSVRLFRRLSPVVDRELIELGRYSTPSSTCSEEAAPGGYSPTISCRGRPPTITSGLGAWTEPGRGSTPPYTRGCAACWVESPSPAQRSSTPRRPKLPRKAVSGGEGRAGSALLAKRARLRARQGSSARFLYGRSDGLGGSVHERGCGGR